MCVSLLVFGEMKDFSYEVNVYLQKLNILQFFYNMTLECASRTVPSCYFVLKVVALAFFCFFQKKAEFEPPLALNSQSAVNMVTRVQTQES